MDYQELFIEIWDLEDWLQEITNELFECEKEFKSNYKNKYIDLLFEFYSSTYNFSSITSEVCDTSDNNDVKELMIDFEKFISDYSRLIQFFGLLNVEAPNNFWNVFNNWKNIWIDLKDELINSDEIDEVF